MGELCRSADLMMDGFKRGYCVPAYDTNNYETTQMVFRAAEIAETPVIIMLYPGPYIPFDTFADMVKSLGKKSKVPFALHLDHSPSFDICMQAIHAGFTSVMIDASKKPYAENVAECRAVVRAAHAMGIDVEGELGTVGREEAVDRNGFTSPEQAAQFLEDTGLDTLAVAIGNCHGVYVGEPDLDIPLLARIKASVTKPLVLHGASGIPKDQLMDACRNGICKTNVATEYLIKYAEVIDGLMHQEDKPTRFGAVMDRSFQPVVDFIADKMKVFNPDHLKLI
jgi:ketose-bisphosphate aldolase